MGLALTACHLVAGLDDYTKGTASAATTGSGGDGDGGATTSTSSGNGGSGGVGGQAPVDPILWQSNLGAKSANATGPAVALGDLAIVGGIVDAPVDLPGLSGSQPTSSLPGNYFGALLTGANTAMPAVSTAFWSRDTSNGTSATPVEITATSDGKRTWLGAVLQTVGSGGDPHSVVVHASTATTPAESQLVSTSGLTISRLALAATPDGTKLYVAYTVYSGTFETLRVIRNAVSPEGVVSKEVEFNLGSVTGHHHVASMVATSEAMYLATTCKGDLVDPDVLSKSENACVVAARHTYDPMANGLEFKRRLGCNETGTSTRALALAASGKSVYLALESTCAKLETSVGVGNYAPPADGPEPKSFGIFAFDETEVLGAKADTNGFKKVSAYTSPISRTAKSRVAMTPLATNSGGKLLVAGSFTGQLKVGPQQLRTAKATSPQAFVLGFETTLALPAPTPPLFATDGPGGARVMSLASRDGVILLGARRTGEVTFGNEVLPAKGLDEIDFVVAAESSLLEDSTP